MLLEATKKITTMVYSDIDPVEISNTALQLVEVHSNEVSENYFEKAVESYGKGSKRIASY
jgi:hypothetical protein